MVLFREFWKLTHSCWSGLFLEVQFRKLVKFSFSENHLPKMVIFGKFAKSFFLRKWTLTKTKNQNLNSFWFNLEPPKWTKMVLAGQWINSEMGERSCFCIPGILWMRAHRNANFIQERGNTVGERTGTLILRSCEETTMPPPPLTYTRWHRIARQQEVKDENFGGGTQNRDAKKFHTGMQRQSRGTRDKKHFRNAWPSLHRLKNVTYHN